MESAGLCRRKAGCGGLRVGMASRPSEGLRGDEWRKEVGEWSASAMEEEEEEESKSLKKGEMLNCCNDDTESKI